MKNPAATVKIGIVGKYVDYEDSYKSLKEALIHGGLAHNLQVDLKWIEAEGGEGRDHEQGRREGSAERMSYGSADPSSSPMAERPITIALLRLTDRQSRQNGRAARRHLLATHPASTCISFQSPKRRAPHIRYWPR